MAKAPTTTKKRAAPAGDALKRAEERLAAERKKVAKRDAVKKAADRVEKLVADLKVAREKLAAARKA